MGKHQIEMYSKHVWGIPVSKYGLEHGRLDYSTLAEMVGSMIMNNVIRSETVGVIGYWEMIHGEFDNAICQDYIISERGYRVLEEYTDEVVFYNEELDLYIWSVDHIGTGWDYVLTDIELIDMG